MSSRFQGSLKNSGPIKAWLPLLPQLHLSWPLLCVFCAPKTLRCAPSSVDCDMSHGQCKGCLHPISTLRSEGSCPHFPSQLRSTIKTCLGDLPFFTEEEAPAESNESKPAPTSVTPVVSSKRPAVLADGTYATQSAAVELAAVAPVTTLAAAAAAAANLRALLLTGDFFLGSVIATTLTKLVLRLEDLHASKVRLTTGYDLSGKGSGRPC